MNWRTIGLASSALALAACQTAPTGTQVETRTKVIDTACNWTKPIYLDKADVLSDATAREILEHNLTGAKNCGWKPLVPSR
ncbi:hypothetical protein B7759_02072 [Burkholderia glumae]|uniref:hypothetical protein n=1 Tax=Burkholderia glumae TaxID=337 RepID=UPI001BB531AB|nr:hypothetical protein [Burkholderia glumae]QTP33478.1 hypothetical protein B7759_02072 [Burkholderia glumae]